MAENDGTSVDAETPAAPAPRAVDPCPRALLIGSCVAASCVGVEYGLIYPTIYPYLRELGTHPTVLAGVAAAAARGLGPIEVLRRAGWQRQTRFCLAAPTKALGAPAHAQGERRESTQ